MNNIALQLYSIREAAKNDLLGTIQRIGEMGYHGAQFAGFFDNKAKDVKEKMRTYGIKPAGAHTSIEQLQNNFNEILSYHNTIENSLIICPYLPENMRTNEADYRQTAELLNEIGKKLRQEGIVFGYHNHAFEFDILNEKGETGFDLLYENTDPEYVKMELDCYWAFNAGYNPLEIIEKYSNRCVSLHIKDMKEEGEKKSSTEIGTGVLDIESLIQTGRKHHVPWFVVEQEDFTKDPMESAKENIEELSKYMVES